MKMRIHPHEKFVGWFVLGAIVVLVGALFLSLQDSLASSHTFYVTLLESTEGLSVGDRVTMRGFVVGEITSIELDEDDNIDIAFVVREERHYERVRMDASLVLHAPLPPVLPGSIEILPGGQDMALPDESRFATPDAPKASVKGILGSVAAIADNAETISTMVRDEGITRLFGPEIHTTIERQIQRAEEATELFLDAAKRANTVSRGLSSGELSLKDLMLGRHKDGSPVTVMEALLGPQAQARLDTISAGGGGMLEVFTGPTVWREVEAMAHAWQSVHANLIDLMGEGRVLLQQSQTLLDDIEPLLATVGDNAQAFDAMIENARQIFGDVGELADAFAAESSAIGPMTAEARDVLHNATQLTTALKRHWLLAGFVPPEPARRFTVGPARRPNPYGE